MMRQPHMIRQDAGPTRSDTPHTGGSEQYGPVLPAHMWTPPEMHQLPPQEESYSDNRPTHPESWIETEVPTHASPLTFVARSLKRWFGGKHQKTPSAQTLTPEGLALPETHETAHIMSRTAEAFWKGESLRTAPRFLQQIERLKAPGQQEARQNVIMTKPSRVIIDGRTKASFTEREGLLDLNDFLNKVIRTAHGKADLESMTMFENASSMRQELSFIGKEELEEACAGVASMWREYVAQGEDYILNIYSPNADRDYQRSYNFIASKLRNAFLNLTQQDPELAERIKMRPEDWVDSPNAKLLVVDDWITSGTTILGVAAAAMATARREGLPELADKLEAHVLIRRANQKLVTRDGDRRQIPIKSYYETTDSGSPFRVSPSGAHSSVDYGFESPLDQMHAYLERQRVYRGKALLTEIQRSYQTAPELQNPEQVALLNEIATLNDIDNQLRNQASEMHAIDTQPFDDAQYQALAEQLAANMRSQQAIEKRRQDLIVQFRKLDKDGA